MATKTALLHPTADVLKNWTPVPVVADHFLLVNGNPLASDDVTTYILSGVVNQRERFRLDPVPSDFGTLISLTLRARLRGGEDLGLEDSFLVRLYVNGLVQLEAQPVHGGDWVYFPQPLSAVLSRRATLEIEFITAVVVAGNQLSDFDLELVYDDPHATTFTPLPTPSTTFTPII